MTDHRIGWRAYRAADTLLLLAFVTAIIVGIWGRFKGIGVWPVANDEYHTAQSIRMILDSGLPRFDCGGYYLRGLLLQYLYAGGLLAFSGEEEFILRAVTATVSLLGAPALFLIARQVGGSRIAIGVLILFFLSLWQIETARYIRWYGPFQTVFLWHTWFVLQACEEGKVRHYLSIFGLSIVGVLVYEAGIFLTMLNFIPLVFRKERSLALYSAAILSTFAVITYYVMVRGSRRDPGLVDAELSGFFGRYVQFLSTLPVELPKIAIPAVLSQGVSLAALLLTSLLAVYFVFRHIRRAKPGNWWKILILVVLVLSSLHQFGLVAISLVLFWLFRPNVPRSTENQNWKFLTLLVSVWFAFWLGYFMLFDQWHAVFDVEVTNSLKKALVLLAKYPDVYSKFMFAWFEGQPVFVVSMVTFFAVCAILRVFLKKEPATGERVLLVTIVSYVTFVAITQQPYHAAKYTFYLQPLILLLAMLQVRILATVFHREVSSSQLSIWVLLVCLSFFFTEDYSIQHIRDIDDKDVNFRSDYPQGLQYHLWYRMDYRTPAEFVNNHAKPEDIVVATMLPVNYYLNRLDIFFRRGTAAEYKALSACGGTKEIWSNAEYISAPSELEKYLRPTEHAVWILARSMEFPFQSTDEYRLEEQLAKYLMFRGLDSRINVYYVPGDHSG